MNLGRLWLHENRICHICGEEVPFEQATRDHIIPGDNSTVRLAHRICNNRRANDNGRKWVEAHPNAVGASAEGLRRMARISEEAERIMGHECCLK